MNRLIQEKGYQALEEVQKEHEDNSEDMENLFHKMERTCTTDREKAELNEFKSQHALTMMLLHQRKLVAHMRHEGVLSDLDVMPLYEEINKKLADISGSSPQADIAKGVSL